MTNHTKQDPDSPDSNESKAGRPHTPEERTATTPKEIPVVSIPNDQDMIAEEMAALFEEDQVTHQHGSAEPEGD